MIDITSHIAFQPGEDDFFILLKLTHDLMRKNHGRNAQRRKGGREKGRIKECKRGIQCTIVGGKEVDSEKERQQ
jgi:hypothetical protein